MNIYYFRKELQRRMTSSNKCDCYVGARAMEVSLLLGPDNTSVWKITFTKKYSVLSIRSGHFSC